MTYRAKPDRIRPTDLAFDEWLIISLSLAAGAAAFISIFHFVMWVIGMPGPLLWMGSADRLADITATTAGISLTVFFFNMFGAFFILAFTAIRRRLRAKD